MRISSIALMPLNFAAKGKNKKNKPNQSYQNSILRPNSVVENDVFERKLNEIWEEDPNFRPNQKVATRLMKLKGPKLSKFDSKSVKKALSAPDKDKAERVISGINIIEKHSADEIKLLMSDDRGRNYLICLMEGAVPKGSMENCEILLASALSRLIAQQQPDESTFN